MKQRKKAKARKRGLNDSLWETNTLVMFFLDDSAEPFMVFWEIAISLLIIRLALLYFGGVFLTGCVLGYIRQRYLIPTYHLSLGVAELLEFPLMLVAIAFWARFIVGRDSAPDVAWMRLAIGFVALACMLVVELLGRSIVSAGGQEQRTGRFDKTARLAFAASLLLFGLMPWLLVTSWSRKEVSTSGVADREGTEKVLQSGVSFLSPEASPCE